MLLELPKSRSPSCTHNVFARRLGFYTSTSIILAPLSLKVCHTLVELQPCACPLKPGDSGRRQRAQGIFREKLGTSTGKKPKNPTHARASATLLHHNKRFRFTVELTAYRKPFAPHQPFNRIACPHCLTPSDSQSMRRA